MTTSENNYSPGRWFRSAEACARFFFVAVFAFPLYPYRLANVVLALAMGFTLIAFLIRPFRPWRVLRRNLVFVVPFLPYLLEWILKGSDPSVHFEFERKIFFFSAPILLPLIFRPSDSSLVRKALLVFSLSVVLLGVYGCLSLIFSGIPFEAEAYRNGAYLLRERFSEFTGLHPTYYSLFAVSAFCFLLCRLPSSPRPIRTFFVIAALLLLPGILVLAARIAIPALFFAGIMLVWNGRGSRTKKLGTILATGFGLVAMTFVVPSLNARMSEIESLRTVQSNDGNTLAQRIAIFNCSAELIAKHPLTGAGSADAIRSLCDCYENMGWEAGKQGQYNPHNQFLSFAAAYGIPLTLVFVFCLLLILRRSWVIPEGRYFAMLVLLFFLTESILERQMGVYYFGMLGMLLMNADMAGAGECNSL